MRREASAPQPSAAGAGGLRGQVGLGAGAERGGGRAAGGQVAQLVPARDHELGGQRLVAVEDGSAAGLLDHVERDLGAGAKLLAQERGGLEREVPQRIVETSVA